MALKDVHNIECAHEHLMDQGEMSIMALSVKGTTCPTSYHEAVLWALLLYYM
jgi:hypothetical protein